jgi:hypothetical protein
MAAATDETDRTDYAEFAGVLGRTSFECAETGWDANMALE